MTFIFILFSLFSHSAFAEDPPGPIKSESSFAEGLSSYEKKDFDQAILQFSRALALSPNNPSTLTNLALSYFQKNQLGFSIGYFRKALSADPDFGPAQSGLEFALTKLPIKEIPHRNETYESFRKLFLVDVSIWFFVLFSAFVFLVSGLLLIRYAGQRKKALEEDLPLPNFPSIGILLSVVFVSLVGLLFFKFYDLQILRGTIVAAKSSVLTAPQAQASSLYEIPEGLEVIIHREQQDWVQVTYPGTATGWIPKDQVLAVPSSWSW